MPVSTKPQIASPSVSGSFLPTSIPPRDISITKRSLVKTQQVQPNFFSQVFNFKCVFTLVVHHQDFIAASLLMQLPDPWAATVCVRYSIQAALLTKFRDSQGDAHRQNFYSFKCKWRNGETTECTSNACRKQRLEPFISIVSCVARFHAKHRSEKVFLDHVLEFFILSRNVLRNPLIVTAHRRKKFAVFWRWSTTLENSLELPVRVLCNLCQGSRAEHFHRLISVLADSWHQHTISQDKEFDNQDPQVISTRECQMWQHMRLVTYACKLRRHSGHTCTDLMKRDNCSHKHQECPCRFPADNFFSFKTTFVQTGLNFTTSLWHQLTDIWCHTKQRPNLLNRKFGSFQKQCK